MSENQRHTLPLFTLDTAIQKVQMAKDTWNTKDPERVCMFVIEDEEGNFLAGKTRLLLHTLRSKVDIEKENVSFRRQGEAQEYHFHLYEDRTALNTYLSDYFQQTVHLVQNKTGRFLDVPDFGGLTVLSSNSLKAVASWFNDMDLEETRKRFRATIEIENVPAFWEDHLFSSPGKPINFKIGEVNCIGISPRERCVVPPRHPETGEVLQGFQKTFAINRSKNLPGYSKLNEFGHHYYLAVDCEIKDSEVGKWITVGDEVEFIEQYPSN